jgi:endo-1,4-beta-xylanase
VIGPGVLFLVVAGGCAGESTTLRDVAAEAGVSIGAAFVERNDDARFREVLAREFSSTTAPIYWNQVHPDRETWDFTVPDEAVALAEANGMRVRGHPLVWGRLGLPAYVRELTDPDALRAELDVYLTTVLGRYRGRIDQYDVVNEPLSFFGEPGETDGLDRHVFLELLGPGFIAEVLSRVSALEPDAELFVNEFGVMAPGEKQERFYRLVEELVRAGAPIDGVGFQSHIAPPYWRDFAPTREETAAAVARFGALGLAVELTEADVTLRDPDDPLELERQRGVYHDLAAACFGVDSCTGLTTWGVTDKHTWIEGFFGVDGAPLLFDARYRRKPAYHGVLDALRGLVDGDR